MLQTQFLNPSITDVSVKVKQSSTPISFTLIERLDSLFKLPEPARITTPEFEATRRNSVLIKVITIEVKR